MTFLRLVPVFLMVTACSGSDDDPPPPPVDTTDTETTPTADTSPEPPGAEMVMTAANNYTYTASWSLSDVEARSEYDLVLSWVSLTTDAWGEARDPAEYPQLVLFETQMSTKELETRLATDDLGGFALISTWYADVLGRAFQDATQLRAGKGTGAIPFDPGNFLVEDPTKSWLMALADTDGSRYDIRAAAIVRPADASVATRAEIDDTTSSYTWSASFAGEPLTTSADLDGYAIDWRDLENNVHGVELDRFVVDQLFIGRFDGMVPTDLESSVHDLQSVSSAWWTMDVLSEREALLELARDGLGTNFGGFTAGSTWLIGTRCTTCLGPAPQFVAVVDVQ